MRLRSKAMTIGLIAPFILVSSYSISSSAADKLSTSTVISSRTTVVPGTNTAATNYTIGPQDMLTVDVFQIPDLSRTVQVDSSGQILLPLIGEMRASGHTAEQLSSEITKELGRKYVKDPLVTVTVKDSLSQKVTVDGAVMQPGVYSITGNTTLLQAVALAKGPDQHVANLSKVAIFRGTGDQRTAAVFNLDEIRDGKIADPQVVANDVVVVDTSGTKSFIHNLMGDLAPIFGVFRPY